MIPVKDLVPDYIPGAGSSPDFTGKAEKVDASIDGLSGSIAQPYGAAIYS